MSRSSIVLDTNIVIDWLNGYPQAISIVNRYDEIIISRVTYAEVLVGFNDKEQKECVEELLKECFTIDDTDEEIADIAIAARQDTRIGLLDAFIWATAKARNVIVFSRNTKDFGRDGLQDHTEIPYHTRSMATHSSVWDTAILDVEVA